MSAIEPDISKWEAWSPWDAARLLEGVEAPWYVAAGWGIDLFLGGVPREHEDLEIAVPNSRCDEVFAALDGLEPFVITGPRQAMSLEGARDRLEETHQTWMREPSTGLWRLDVFREPSEGGTWICRRDASIRMPYARLIERADDGVPYGRPEVILLFKARHAERERDQGDFERTLPHLGEERRGWLRAALERVHPGHQWLAPL